MQEKLTINLSPEILNAVTGEVSKKQIHTELRNHTTQIASLLSGYHWDEKGIVNSIEIEPETITLDKTGKGNFKVRYGINIHYGCSDVDIDLDKAMVITIEVNTETGTALLTGEYIPEREPDGY